MTAARAKPKRHQAQPELAAAPDGLLAAADRVRELRRRLERELVSIQVARMAERAR